MNIRTKHLLLGACAAIALAACGGDDAKEGHKATTEVSADFGTSSVDKPFKLKDAEAVDVDALLAGFGVEGMFVYDSSEFDADKGATVITNLRYAGEDSPLNLGRLELYGLNTDAISALAEKQEMTSVEEMFRKVRVYDFKAAFPLDNKGVGTFSVDALDVDSFAIKVGGNDTVDNDEGKEFAGMAKSVKLGGVDMKGFSLSLDDAPDLGDLTINAERFQVGSYDAGVFGGLKMSGAEYSMAQDEKMIEKSAQAMGPAADVILNTPLKNFVFPENQSGTFGSMSWDGISIAGLMGYLENGEKPPVTATDLISVGGMTMADVTQSINGKEVGSVKKVIMSPIEFEHFMPKAIKVMSEGEVTDYTAFVGEESPEILDILKKNGLDNVTGNSKFEYKFSSKDKTISVNSESVSKGLLGVDFDLNIGNFDYAALVSDDGNEEEAIMGMAIEGMTLKLDDEKLVDTGFAIAGAVTEQDPAQLRQQVVGLISLGSLQGGSISPRIPAYATALSSFISEGGELEIKIDPETAATFGELATMGESDPAATLEALNLTVSHK